MGLLNKTNMKNEFVIYEQALALKELGFDEPCLAFYSPKEELHPVFQEPSKGPYFNNGSFIETLRAPLYQQAFRWFREKYGLYTDIFVDDDKTFGFMITYFIGKDYFDERVDRPIQRNYSTYEEVEQVCLDKLIEICKNK
jgi:hypothetical protein